MHQDPGGVAPCTPWSLPGVWHLLGHAAGDIVLASIATRLTAWAGPCAAIGPLGGDEFAVVLQLMAADRVAPDHRGVALSATTCSGGDVNSW
ncbi:diguanylate cyclase domain-containing protein [Streptomyces kanasensis]|uniref:diguanylate cyclase domain-containing protein n=1 Tax=Streptomyces kanasensis TaxID=936756 RepID=UPI00380EB4D5